MNSILRQVKLLSRTAIVLAVLALLFAGAIRPAHAQTYTPLYEFGVGGLYETNSFPLGQLALGRDGNFYGTVQNPNGHSGIYEITPDGVATPLWWDTSPDYTQCLTGLTLGSDGLFYGTCQQWGGNGYETGGSGVVFKYDPSQGQNGFTVLYSWPECNTDGSLYPNGLTLGTDGNFYGTTGGNTFCPDKFGSVFQVTPTGTFTTLHSFLGFGSAGDGEAPTGPLTLGADGNFYGTTPEGGNSTSNTGTVFQITPTGKIKYIYNFTNAVGYYPAAGVTQGADGKFYGTTQSGGTSSVGTLFQLTTAGKIDFLHSFDYAVDDVSGPVNPLTLGTDGSLYGPANCYSWGCGAESLYKITTKGVFTVLYNGFTDPNNACPDNSLTGCYLSSPMALHPNGTFYGTTMQGGVYEGDDVGHGVFYSFSNGLKPYIILQYPRGMISTSIGIFGVGFTGATAVSFHGVAADFTVVSDTYLTATIPAGATTGYVTVTEPSQTLTSAVKFTVLVDKNPKPTITSLSPSSVTAGSAEFTLTVYGTGFMNTSVVNWAGSPLTTTYVSGTQITAPVSAADVAKAGTYKVTVTNPAPGGGTTTYLNFTVDNPAPTLTKISPSSATHGGAAFTLTTTGTSYVSGSSIEWKGIKLTTTYVSSTKLTATVPSTDIKTAGTANVTVFNPTPGGGTSAPLTFTID